MKFKIGDKVRIRHLTLDKFKQSNLRLTYSKEDYNIYIEEYKNIFKTYFIISRIQKNKIYSDRPTASINWFYEEELEKDNLLNKIKTLKKLLK
jgi:hypothetical protein